MKDKSDSMPKESFNRCITTTKVSDEYILNSAINDVSKTELAISTSANEILLYDIERQTELSCFKGHQNVVTGIKFSREEPHILLSSSLDALLTVWDLRSGTKSVKSYCDNTDSCVKPLTCFDYNVSEQYLCAGTEVIKEDSFLIFWDKRSTTPVGGYWESHYSEITQVQFHLTSESHLTSSSVDGLINLYNLHETTEDDALQNTLNIGAAVNNFCWSATDTVAAITSIDEFQFWFTFEGKPTRQMSKKQISEDFMCDVDYLISTFDFKNVTYLTAGTNQGSMQLYSCGPKGLKIMSELNNGHSDVIRTCSHSKTGSYFITGGEDGVICTWSSPL